MVGLDLSESRRRMASALRSRGPWQFTAMIAGTGGGVIVGQQLQDRFAPGGGWRGMAVAIGSGVVMLLLAGAAGVGAADAIDRSRIAIRGSGRRHTRRPEMV